MLERIGTLMELKGDNFFHCRSYYNAARVLETYDGSLEALASSEETVKGIGKGMRERISEILETGTTPQLVELEAESPCPMRYRAGCDVRRWSN